MAVVLGILGCLGGGISILALMRGNYQAAVYGTLALVVLSVVIRASQPK